MSQKQSDTYVIRDLYAKPEKIYPRQVHGRFARLRILSVLLLLGIYYISPWLTWNGNQAILLDLPARKFHLFGVTFWPQDFVYLTLLLVICAVGLFLFTAIAGRLWCGYACPQTVWTETFLWIEQFVEGNRNKRMKLDKQPLGPEKIIKKTLKHTLWIVFALFTGYTFVGYFSPIRELWDGILTLSLGPWEWFWIGLYSLATYGNAGKLREQVCLHMCPYARFQSAMFDKDTLIISYDETRGESRGKRKKNSDYKAKGLGDCIDCNQCVHVCPTGIDIRNGLQYECIACAACIDVCDNVMDQMGYSRGLIQYTTEHSEEGRKTELIRPRSILYTMLFSGLILTFIFLIATRTPLDVNVIRDRQNLFTENFDGSIENTYQLKILNMSQDNHNYKLSIEGLDKSEIHGETEFEIEAGGVLTVPLRVSVPPEELNKRANDIVFKISTLGEDKSIYYTNAKFLGPKK
ncbi:cytochrome c oxidase accessory protein CcoG [Aliikangiella sp. G2MR2-5]|uniref:cytochrome c oxidase accessory protein CcoG n=1 Tax=Aliikangiella sp. G2MR2-5 TaxID=2788943 RepID=UPI0018AB3C5F|nr:cytochrome c oxidase accessory protein CcoG [Aliikangiella sp. G2MR2-5]